MKKLYFEEGESYKPVDVNGEVRDDDDEMIERINNRIEYSFSYIGYVMMSFASRCCCCCKKAMVMRWPWYGKKWLSYQKFKKARDDLAREKDIEHMIYNLRILKFMQKTTLKKR